MGWREELDSIDEKLSRAPTVPLTDQVRVDKAYARAAVDALEASLPILNEERGEPTVIGAIATNLIELRRALTEAPQIPLTSQLRVDREAAYDLIDRLRAGIAPAAVKARFIAEGGPGEAALEPLGKVVVDAAQLRDLILGPRLMNFSRKVRFDALEANSLIGDLQSNLPDVESAVRAAGLATPGRAPVTETLERISGALRERTEAAPGRYAELRRREVSPLLDQLDDDLYALIHSAV